MQPNEPGLTVITGASAGIGAAFADSLASRGHDLLLVSRSSEALKAQSSDLSARYGVRVEHRSHDLSEAPQVSTLAAVLATSERPVEMLINNAGFATHGRFETIDPGLDHRQAMLNVVATVDLCHAVLPAMVERGSGTIINVASLGAFQPAPYLAVYAASKAFQLSLSEALASELSGTGVRVVALCPGPVSTGFFDGLGSTDAAVGQQLSPAQVVTECLRQLDRGRRIVVPGRLNFLAAQASRILPRRVIAGIAKRSVGPGGHDQPSTRPSVDELSATHEAHSLKSRPRDRNDQGRRASTKSLMMSKSERLWVRRGTPST